MKNAILGSIILMLFVFPLRIVEAGSTEASAGNAGERHADLVDDFLEGSSYAAGRLRAIGLPAWESVRPRWAAMDDAARWRLLVLRNVPHFGREGCVPTDVAFPYAIQSLSSEDRDIRRRAIRYVGDNEVEDARAVLLERLNDEDPVLRWAMLYALTKIGGDDVVRRLIILLEPDSWAARGEGLIRPPGPLPHWWPDGRYHIVNMLKQLDAVESANALLAVLRERGPGRAYLGTAIIPCIEQFKYRLALPELRSILAYEPPPRTSTVAPSFRIYRDEDHIKRLAARALFSMGDDSGVELLARNLSDDDSRWSRQFSAEAFAQLGGASHLPLLAKALRDEYRRVRRVAVQGFRRITTMQLEGEEWGLPETHANKWLTWWAEQQSERN